MKDNIYEKIFLIFFFPILFFLFSLAVNGAEVDPTKESYLFVHSSPRAILRASKDYPITYTVTLEKVPPMVVYFSDRPVRKSGVIPVEQYIRLWNYKGDRNFKDFPPNAVLHSIKSGLMSSDQVSDFAIQIINPIYNKEKETVTFTAKPIPGSDISLSDCVTLHHVSIFVDDACLSCMWE